MATRKSLIGNKAALLGSSGMILKPSPVATKAQPKATEKKQTAPALYEELTAGNGEACPVILTDDRETGLLLTRIAGAVSRVVLIDVKDVKKVVQATQAVKERYSENELIAAWSRENARAAGELAGKGIFVLDAVPREAVSWLAVKDAQGLDATAAQFRQAVDLARLLRRVHARINRGREYQPMNANAILSTDYGEPVWAVDELIPAGVTLLASRPKKGKSWLALQMALAVAQGVPFMGLDTKNGPVFYAALEDTPRRLQKRMKALGVDELAETQRERLIFATSFPVLDEDNGIAELARIITEKKPSLVIFDVWRRCQPEIKESGLNAQQKDYKAIFPLTCLAAETETPILVLTHQNKQASKASEMLDGVADSLGLSGAVDGIITLNRDGQSDTAYLKREGREYESTEEIHIAWQKGGGWRLATAQEVQERANEAESETKRQIRQALERSVDENGRVIPLSFTEIVNVTGLGRGSVSSALSRMKEVDAVIQDSTKKYRLNPALSISYIPSALSQNNNNICLDTLDTLDTVDTADTVDTKQSIRTDTRVDTTANTDTERLDVDLYPEYPEYPRKAEYRDSAGNVSQTSFLARIMPYYKGKNADEVAKALAPSIVECQRVMIEAENMSQLAQGVLFPEEASQ